MILPNGHTLHGILFSTPMALANIERRKTETRRIAGGLKTINKLLADGEDIEFEAMRQYKDGTYRAVFLNPSNDEQPYGSVICPYGQPGDWLYQKETVLKMPVFRIADIVYKTDNQKTNGWHWHPSIHMPLSAARCFLLIEEIRVERLQDITQESAIAEGINIIKGEFENLAGETITTAYEIYGRENGVVTGDPKYSYEYLWRSINGPDSWNSNPYVWVVKYKGHTLQEFETHVGTTIIELDKLIKRK